jgi:hypothetical protein
MKSHVMFAIDMRLVFDKEAACVDGTMGRIDAR